MRKIYVYFSFLFNKRKLKHECLFFHCTYKTTKMTIHMLIIRSNYWAEANLVRYIVNHVHEIFLLLTKSISLAYLRFRVRGLSIVTGMNITSTLIEFIENIHQFSFRIILLFWLVLNQLNCSGLALCHCTKNEVFHKRFLQ